MVRKDWCLPERLCLCAADGPAQIQHHAWSLFLAASDDEFGTLGSLTFFIYCPCLFCPAGASIMAVSLCFLVVKAYPGSADVLDVTADGVLA